MAMRYARMKRHPVNVNRHGIYIKKIRVAFVDIEIIFGLARIIMAHKIQTVSGYIELTESDPSYRMFGCT